MREYALRFGKCPRCGTKGTIHKPHKAVRFAADCTIRRCAACNVEFEDRSSQPGIQMTDKAHGS